MNKPATIGPRRCAIRLAAALLVGTTAAAVWTAPAHAQESTASVRGTITSGGQPVASQVVATEVSTGFRRVVPVGADGSYNIPSLRPGTYRLDITAGSVARRTEPFELLVGQNARLDIDLAEASVTEAGPVDPAAPAAPAAAAGAGGGIIVVGNRIRRMEGGEVGVNITQREIEQLPQNNRNFLAFADLAPGVQFVTGGNGQSRLQGGAQDSRTINVFIDGVGQKDYVLKNGVTGQDSTQGNPFPQLGIGEYRVISSNYKAEFDQVSSVAITAVTKSGTNEFHGEGFVDFTNQRLRAGTADERFGNNRGKVETRDFQFGGALGGPIIRDLAHFFFTYEGKRQQNPVEINPGLDLPVSFFPSQYQGVFGSTNATFKENLYFGKIDVAPTDKDLIELSAKRRQESGEFLGSGINSRSTISSQNVKELRGLLRWEHSEDAWINDLKLTYENAKWAPTPLEFGNASLFAYAAPIPGVPNSVRRGDILRVGGGSNYQDKGQKGYGIQNDLTWIGFDNHTIKAGVKAKWVTLNSLQLNQFNPVYTYNVAFPNPTGFNETIPYRVQFGAATGNGSPIVKSKNFQLGLYIQDDWDVTDRLTLNLGVRWDYERTPAYLDFVHPADAVNAVSPANYPNLINANYDINDYISTGSERKAFMGAIQPRIGFSYAIDEARRFVLFGGYGRSYDRNQFDFLQQEISVGSFTTRTFNFITGDPFNTCAPSPTCVPFNPIYLTEEGRAQLVANAGAGGGRELRFINNDLKVPYSDQFSLGLRSRFGLFEPEIGYTHIVSKDGFAYLLGNRRPDGSFFPPAPAAPNSPFGFAPPGFGSIIIGTNGLETKADSAYLKFVKRYTARSPWNVTATYTFTKAFENRNFGEVFSLDFPSLDDYPVTRSGGVRKHRFVAAGAVDLPFEFTLSGKLTVSSAPYIKAFINTGGPTPERTVVSREAFGDLGGWAFRQLDLALTKYLSLPFLTDETRVWARVDVLNVMNDRNYVNYNNNPNDNVRTSPTDTIYRERTGFGTGGNPPRTFKVSTGFSF